MKIGKKKLINLFKDIYSGDDLLSEDRLINSLIYKVDKIKCSGDNLQEFCSNFIENRLVCSDIINKAMDGGLINKENFLGADGETYCDYRSSDMLRRYINLSKIGSKSK